MAEEESKDEASYIPDEFKLLSESIGFGEGFERTFEAWAVFIVSKEGKVETWGSRTDRYFKTRLNAEKEAERINFRETCMYDRESGNYVRRDPSRIRYVAFPRKIEVTERIA